MAGLVLIHYQNATALQVPPGFEALAKGQAQWLDVSLYGESLGLYHATVNLETVHFIDPEKLIKAILKRYGNRPELKALLDTGISSSLARNDSLSCSTDGGRPGCGYINPKSVALIFDENNGSADLFISGQFAPVNQPDDVYFRNEMDSRNGFIHQQNLNFVSDSDYQSVSLQGNGTLGLGDSAYANVDWIYLGQHYRNESNTQLAVSNAYVRQDVWKKVYLQAGQMDSRDIFSRAGGSLNLSQLPVGPLRGVRIGSTQAWINQDKVQHGTPLTVFISQDSRVDAYRDSRLLQSYYLKPGMQTLDTRGFPPGSYTVTLKIYEDNHLARTQTVPYISLGASEDNSFQWFMQAGKLVSDTTTDDDSRQVVLGGARLPLTASLALTAGATLLNNVNYEEGALDWRHGFDSGALDGVLAARVSYLHGSDGSAGNIQQLSYNDGFSLSFYRSAISSPDCNTRSEKRYSYSGCYTSSSAMLSVPVKSWNTTLGYTDSRNEGRYLYRSQLAKTNTQYGNGAPWDQIFTTRSRSRTWQAGLSRAFNWSGLNISTSLSAFLRRDSSYANMDKGGYVTVSLYRTTPPESGGAFSSSSLSASWNTSRYGTEQLGYGGSYSRYGDNTGDNETGASVSGVNTDTISALAYRRFGSQYGRGSLTLSDAYDRNDGRHALSVSGSYNSSVAIDQDGFFWGRWGDGTPSSAVTFGIGDEGDEGDEDNKMSRARVGVDSGVQADVRAGSRTMFTVPGYQQSTLSVGESASVTDGISSEISRGAGSRTLFMMPGRVFYRDVSVSARYTWLGRMTDAGGHPLQNAIPLNVASWSPLGDGAFSLETSRPLKALYLLRGDEYLQCPVSVKERKDVVRWVGTVRCEDISLVSLPAAEKRQAELMTAGISKEGNKTAALSRK